MGSERDKLVNSMQHEDFAAQSQRFSQDHENDNFHCCCLFADASAKVNVAHKMYEYAEQHSEGQQYRAKVNGKEIDFTNPFWFYKTTTDTSKKDPAKSKKQLYTTESLAKETIFGELWDARAEQFMFWCTWCIPCAACCFVFKQNTDILFYSRFVDGEKVDSRNELWCEQMLCTEACWQSLLCPGVVAFTNKQITDKWVDEETIMNSSINSFTGEPKNFVHKVFARKMLEKDAATEEIRH